MNLSFDASEFVQLADLWKRAPDITRTRLLQAVTACDVELLATLKQNLPRGAGGSAGLAGSVQTDEHALADNVIGMTFTAQPYAQYVEIGTQPHIAPIQPLLDWVRVKFGLLDLAAKNAAYAIRAAIAKRGTKANPVWQQTWDAKQGFINDQFDDAVDAIARDLSGGVA